jgi:Uma2 family endonuclease
VPTVILDPQPSEIDALIERRRRLDLDRNDEVWEGVYHMNPAPHGRHSRIQLQLGVLLDSSARAKGLQPMAEFNIGEKDDFRVPDGGLLRPGPDELYYSTAALVLEIVSPGDETWKKFSFYAAHEVDELLIVDPQECAVRWFALDAGEYREVERSRLIELGHTELTERIDWV